MKQAKLALTAVAVLAMIGGALAFKANRTAVTFYKYGTTTIDSQVFRGCVVTQDLNFLPSPSSSLTIAYSSAFNPTITTSTGCVANVVPNP